MASKKNAKVSINKGRAITCPANCIKFGHSRLNCKPIIVPVTTPTATVITNPLAVF